MVDNQIVDQLLIKPTSDLPKLIRYLHKNLRNILPPLMSNYKKYYTIPAPPDEVYLALTNPLSIKLWSGADVEMSTEPGSEFSLFNGDVLGKNIEFEENKKIVQQWYFDGQEEPSIVTIKLHEHAKGASVELLHTNIPDESYDEFVEGWNTSYFGELLEFFED